MDYWTDEYRYRRADGSVAHVIDRGYFIFDKDCNPLRMIGALVEITKLVHWAEAEIQSATEERQRLPLNLGEKQIAQIIAFLKTLDGLIKAETKWLTAP